MPRTRRIDIAVLPAEARSLPAELFVVVDALRATTMIATLLSGGARSVTVADSEDGARALAGGGAILAGEVGGLPPAGFAMGNSPVEAAAADVAGREVVLFTTNGTRALCAAAALGPTVAGALTNGEAVANHCGGFSRVALVCAGNDRGLAFSIEDFVVAGAIAERIAQKTGDPEMGDGALLARRVLTGDVPGAVRELMRAGSHARVTRDLGLEDDIDAACRADSTGVVPAVVASGKGWARLVAQS